MSTGMTADCELFSTGSIHLLTPRSYAGRKWITRHLRGALTYGPAVVVEGRYLPAVLEGLRASGLGVIGG